MAFDEKLLNTNEEILLDLRPHWWFIIRQLAAVVAVLVIAVAALALGAPSVVNWIVAALLAVAAVALAARWLVWSRTNFVITTDRLIHREGVVKRVGMEIPLERINTVHSSQSVFERLIGSGDLVVESAGEGGQQYFHNVRRAQMVQQEIYRAIEINKQQDFTAMAAAHGSAGATAAPSIPEQIDQLDELRRRGVITDAEFQAKKQDLLDRM